MRTCAYKIENIGACFSRTVSSTAMCFAQALATLKRTAHTKFQVFRARIAAVRSIDRQNQSNRGHNPLLATWWRGRPCKRMSPSPKAPLSLVVPDATSPLGHLRRHSSRLGHGDLGGLPAQADHLNPCHRKRDRRLFTAFYRFFSTLRPPCVVMARSKKCLDGLTVVF